MKIKHLFFSSNIWHREEASLKNENKIKLQQNPLQKQSCNYKKIFPPFISTDGFANIQQQKEKKQQNL